MAQVAFPELQKAGRLFQQAVNGLQRYSSAIDWQFGGVNPTDVLAALTIPMIITGDMMYG